MGLFAVGLGLMLSYFGRGTALGLGTMIFAIAINIQLSPLLQKFWFNVFVGEFNRQTATPNADFTIAFQELNGVFINTIIERGAIAMTISYLISCLATIGRMDLFDTFISLIVYNIMWPIPYYCNLRLYYKDLPSPQNVFDDFGLTFIYTFAGFFGLIYSIFLNRRYDQTKANTIPSKESAILSIFGTTIVFCVIPSTALIQPISNSVSILSTRFNVGVLNVFYSEIAGIISCLTFSMLFGKLKRINIASIIISVLCGPAIVGQWATLEVNISACLTVGAFGGLVAALWTQVFHPMINSKKIEDALSLIGGVLLPSLFGGVAAAPAIYAIYYDTARVTTTGLMNTRDYVRYQFIFYFITVGAAIVCGIFTGIFSFCSRTLENDFTMKKMFSPDFGLCNNPNEHGDKGRKGTE
jgi:hypothetical protein